MTTSSPTPRLRRLVPLVAAAFAGAVMIVGTGIPAGADPTPPPPPPPAPAPAAPENPPAPPAPENPPAPADPGVPSDPNAPAPGPAPAPAREAGRIDNAAGGFSYVLPAGWEVADASRLSYGQALLLKPTGPAPLPGQQVTTATATDTSILLGRLDMKLFAGAEQDNAKAAVRLASDMGEFFMPFPGTRINQTTAPLQAGDIPGSAASYDVKFTDTAKPTGQIWAGVVGNGAARNAGRWFVVWLGTSKDPIDAAAAKNLAQSIRPFTPPPPPPAPAPDPNAPAAPPGVPAVPPVGVPVPVTTPVPGMTPGF